MSRKTRVRDASGGEHPSLCRGTGIFPTMWCVTKAGTVLSPFGRTGMARGGSAREASGGRLRPLAGLANLERPWRAKRGQGCWLQHGPSAGLSPGLDLPPIAGEADPPPWAKPQSRKCGDHRPPSPFPETETASRLGQAEACRDSPPGIAGRTRSAVRRRRPCPPRAASSARFRATRHHRGPRHGCPTAPALPATPRPRRH